MAAQCLQGWDATVAKLRTAPTPIDYASDRYAGLWTNLGAIPDPTSDPSYIVAVLANDERSGLFIRQLVQAVRGKIITTPLFGFGPNVLRCVATALDELGDAHFVFQVSNLAGGAVELQQPVLASPGDTLAVPFPYRLRELHSPPELPPGTIG
jgi:hypothetical protein